MVSQQHDHTAASGPPRVWVLRSTGAGATRQLLTLAERLGWPWEFKDTLDPLPRALLDRLYTPGWGRVPASKRDRLRPPWPDLVLISGGRSVVDALRIKALAGGQCRLVCVGRPGTPLDWFDRIITTPQYQLPPHANVVHNLLPLNRPDPDGRAAAGRDWAPRLSHLPRPWLGVLLGGDSTSYRFSVAAARELGRQLDAQARSMGGALVITGSPRTPADALEALMSELDAPHYCYRWRPDDAGDNPLQAILALADGLVVTADSASMLAEACATGRQVSVFVPPWRWRARVLERSWLPDWLGRSRSALDDLRRRLVIRGLWVPARNMTRVHEALRERGLIRPLHELGRDNGRRGEVLDDLDRAEAAIRSLFPERDQGPTQAVDTRDGAVEPRRRGTGA
jgi:uncharacterized protein